MTFQDFWSVAEMGALTFQSKLASYQKISPRADANLQQTFWRIIEPSIRTKTTSLVEIIL